MADIIPTGFEPVRDTLKTKYNVSDDRIGYDQGADGNWVTIDNQKIFKDPTNIGGTTYAGQDVFGSAAGKINTLNNQYNLTQQALNPAATINPYDQQVNDTLAQILQKVKTPAAIDPYTSPQYTATQAASQRGAQQATRQAQEVLGDSGFSQSTRLADRAQSIQNDANQYLQTQVVPQIIQQLQGAQQQDIGNLSNILGLLQGQQGIVDTRQQNQQNRQFDVLDYVTGRSDRSQDIQREDESITRATEYQTARDKIFDEKDKRDFDEDVRQYGLDYAATQAERKSQRGMEQQRINISEREVSVREKEASARTLEENKQILIEERTGLSADLRSGKIDPVQALQQIDDDLAAGYYTPEQANVLRQDIVRITPTLEASKQTPLTDEQQTQTVTGKALDKVYAEQGQGKPKRDWQKWYNDSRGRLVGVDFDTWHILYGPKLRAR